MQQGCTTCLSSIPWGVGGSAPPPRVGIMIIYTFEGSTKFIIISTNYITITVLKLMYEGNTHFEVDTAFI